MQRLLIITISLLYSCFALAKPSYQIDLIIFAQQAMAVQNSELSTDMPLVPMNAHALSLKTNSGKVPQLYCLLPNSYSSLQDQYYQLSRRSHYPVLGYYSWRQPANNQSTVALPLAEHNGWQMQGTLHVRESNYYSFDAKLQISPPNNPQSSFTVSQKQRLKENVIYYLDNDQIGIVVKIHKVT